MLTEPARSRESAARGLISVYAVAKMSVNFWRITQEPFWERGSFHPINRHGTGRLQPAQSERLTVRMAATVGAARAAGRLGPITG
jgi:hypothetical protein